MINFVEVPKSVMVYYFNPKDFSLMDPYRVVFPDGAVFCASSDPSHPKLGYWKYGGQFDQLHIMDGEKQVGKVPSMLAEWIEEYMP